MMTNALDAIWRLRSSNRGLGLVELIVAIGIIGMVFVPILVVFFLSLRGTAAAEAESTAYFYAQRSIEAAKNIRDRKWEDIANASSTVSYVFQIVNGEWAVVPGSTTTDGYVIETYIKPVLRDSGGAIVESGGTPDQFMKRVDVTATWTPPGTTTARSVRVSNYLTNIGAMNDFVYSFVQTNKDDFEAGTLSNIDTVPRPGEFILTRQTFFSENFESFGAGTDPANWTDTAQNYSLSTNDAMYKIFDVSGNKALGTNLASSSIHSHYTGAGATAWTHYEVRGRMLFTAVTGGVGVTFNSKYPATDRYYRLSYDEATAEDDFILVARGTTLASTGVQDYRTGVVPVPNTWYRFSVQVKDVNAQTLIVGKVWPDGTPEPQSNQIDHFDDSATRSASGTVGVWSTGAGSKYIDDLEVRDLKNYSASGTIVSSPYDTGEASTFDLLSWDFTAPPNTAIGFQLRSATTEAGLSTQSWYGPTNPSDFYSGFWGEAINSVHNGHQWLQYKGILSTTDTSQTPGVSHVKATYVKQ